MQTKPWVLVCLMLACLSFAGRASAGELNLTGDAEDEDYFGYAMGTGDFDCDGDDDLVVGVPGEDDWNGAINVVYSGAEAGIAELMVAGNRLFKYPSFAEAAGTEKRFGWAVTVGNFDGDVGEDGHECDDVAVGAFLADVADDGGSGGLVVVAYGGAGGIDPSVSEVWTQDSTGVLDVSESADWWGKTLASGDFDNDGYDDLVIGAPREAVGTKTNAGAINVLYGSASGVTASGDQFLHLDSPGVKGTADAMEEFASALTTGDFNGDGYADLAVACHGDRVDGVRSVGSVLILPGSSAGLDVDADQLWTLPALGFAIDAGALFSSAIAAGDFDGNGKDDLAIGAPGGFGGGVHLVYGTTSGLSATGAQYFTQETSGVPGSSADDEFFGSALAVGNFGGGSRDDLAIATSAETINGVDSAGAVTVLYGSSSGLSTQTAADYLFQDQTSFEDAERLDKFGMHLASGDFDGDGMDELLVNVLESLLSGDDGFDGAIHVYYGSSGGPVVSTSQFLHQ